MVWLPLQNFPIASLRGYQISLPMQRHPLIEFGHGIGDHNNLFGNLGNDTFDFQEFDAVGRGTTNANSDVIMDFVTGQDKVKAFTESSTPEYTEVAASGVTSVQEAIQFATSNDLFNHGNGDDNEYVFIAGQTNGYLIVNVNSNLTFDPNTDYTIVLQNHNTLDSFGFGDIINVS